MWIMVLFIHTGLLSKNDSLSVTSIPHFKTEQACIEAGKKTTSLVERTVKESRYICVKDNG